MADYQSMFSGVEIDERLAAVSDLQGAVESLQESVAGKVDKVEGKGLSTNDFTNEDKTKLGDIGSGAQANVIETVEVNGTALVPSNKTVDIKLKTINNTPITGEGNIEIQGGEANAVQYIEQSLTDAQKLQARQNIAAQADRVIVSNDFNPPSPFTGKTLAATATAFGITQRQLFDLVQLGKYDKIVYDGASYPTPEGMESPDINNVVSILSVDPLHCTVLLAFGNTPLVNYLLGYTIDVSQEGVVTLDSFDLSQSVGESTSNKVTSWSGTVSDSKYPSEKLVKDSLDGKQETIDSTHKLDYSLLDNTPTIPDEVVANPTVPSGTTPTDLAGLKVGNNYYGLSNKEDKSNKVTSLSSQSTDTQYPSAKCVYDLVGDVETLINAL